MTTDTRGASTVRREDGGRLHPSRRVHVRKRPCRVSQRVANTRPHFGKCGGMLPRSIRYVWLRELQGEGSTEAGDRHGEEGDNEAWRVSGT